MDKKNKLIYWAVFFSFTVLVFFLAFNRHSRAGIFNYHSQIFSDKAGYYIYLPAALKYQFNPNNFPDSIQNKTGNGFQFDFENKKIITKYTCGVALLQLPFYVIIDNLAEPLGFESNGFSLIYNKMIDIAAVFYLLLGLFFLEKFLRYYFKNNIIYPTLLVIFFSTNLLYYSIEETGMSHIYSFFLFCVYLYLLKKTDFLSTKNYLKIISFGIVCGLILLIRPTNIIFMSVFLFLDISSVQEVWQRLKKLFQIKIFLLISVSVFLVLLPQLFYWKQTFGSFFNYSYGEESFNWLNPKTINTWFSPLNGLFLYCPVYLIIMISLYYMIKEKAKNGLLILLLFLLISYVFSCWWEWGFGCAFGARSYVEFLALFSIPVAFIIEKINVQNTTKKVSFWILIIALVFLNFKLIYTYDGCFKGSRNWDWNAFINHLEAPL